MTALTEIKLFLWPIVLGELRTSRANTLILVFQQTLSVAGSFAELKTTETS